ncbi:MAG: hypothetical protein NC393_08400 [Clostridium sp.]|nr:hypothetical protein [Clostridium sp.]MCM1172130.1 hypothetical protein [Clostridium sp.]MCM1208773.1 hypothetical protein [Ruminococcus sp.]
MADMKKLPVTYPTITSWQWHATLFSILSDDENAKKWIFSNYIQLRCYNIQEIFTGDEMLLTDMMPGSSSLKQCPYLVFSLLTKAQIESYCGNIIDFIIKTIDLNGYVYGVFDEAKILCDAEVDYKFPHELFIYGYDRDKEIFYVGDFTFQDHYSYNTVSFSDIERGYEVITEKDDHVFKDDYKGGRGLYVVMKNSDTVCYDVDLELIKTTLREYLNSMDTKNHFRMMRNRFNDTTFGIKVYDKTLAQIEKQVHAEEPDFDIRALHVMYDHKVLMLERIKYLMEHGYLKFNQDTIDEYETVVTNMLTARNLLVRISITGEIEAASRFKKYFDAAKEKEVCVLFKILAELDEK